MQLPGTRACRSSFLVHTAQAMQTSMARPCAKDGGWAHPKDIPYRELTSGKRSTGQPKSHYNDVCKRDMKALDINTENWEEVAAVLGK